MKEQQVPGLFGIDTRALTKKLREHGAMLGRIEFDNISIPFYDPNEHNIVAEVSTKEVVEYGHGKYKVILVDCGVKYNIIRCLLKRDVPLNGFPGIMILLRKSVTDIFCPTVPVTLLNVI